MVPWRPDNSDLVIVMGSACRGSQSACGMRGCLDLSGQSSPARTAIRR